MIQIVQIKKNLSTGGVFQDTEYKIDLRKIKEAICGEHQGNNYLVLSRSYPSKQDDDIDFWQMSFESGYQAKEFLAAVQACSDIPVIEK
jgi:hypothetical protein